MSLSLEFKKALNAGNFEEAKKLLGQFVESGMSEAEQDVMKVLYTHAYMKSVNAVNKEYIKALGEIEKVADDITKEENRLDGIADALKNKKKLLESQGK